MNIQSSLKSIANARLSILICLCLVLGGTAQQTLVYKTPLYIICLIFIGSTLTSKKRSSIAELNKFPIYVGAFLFTLYILYILPLPPVIWSSMDGRGIILEGYKLVGITPTWLPMSLSPEETFFSLFDFIPIIALILIMRLSATEDEIRLSMITLLSIGVISALLGLIQSIGSENNLSFYKFSNEGFPVGFFSNINHQACFFAMLVPLAVYFLFGRKSLIYRWSGAQKLLGVTSLILYLPGTFLLGSLAGYLMIPLGFFISILILKYRVISTKIVRWKLISVCFILVFSLIMLRFELYAFSPENLPADIHDRQNIWQSSLKIKHNFGFWGIGPGSFEKVYGVFEDRSNITRVYINEAHNDYLQILLELGPLGLLVFLAIIVWLLLQISKCLSTASKHRNIKLLFTVSATMPLLHSAVDYPFRTIAISSVFVYMILLLIRYDEKNS